MKKRALCWLVPILFCCLSGVAGAEPAPEVLYFHKTLCESCDPAEEFAERFFALTGQNLSDYRFSDYNALHESGQKKLAEIALQYEIAEPLLPLLIWDGKVYMGEEQISGTLPSDWISEMGSRDSVVYYLFVPACESCARVEAVLSGLPKSVEVTRGTFTFSSDVFIRKIDISQDTATALALFDKYQVPDRDRVAPIVFLPGRYFAGGEKIEALLPAAIRTGMGVGEIDDLEVDSGAALPGVRLSGAILAGLTGGLNPCALSMLLMFLSLLMGGNRPAGRYAALFLGSKFAAYLLIGTVLLSVFQAFNPTWLSIAAKAVLTVLCVGLIALNLRDAVAARRAKYGEIRNQLPKGIRRFLHTRIQRAFELRRGIAGGVILLGMLVAGGEFLCAGQVYLAMLLANLKTGVVTLQAFGALTLYCLAFLFPSAILCWLVLRGRAALMVSQWLLNRMALIKVLTAALLAVILGFAWLF